MNNFDAFATWLEQHPTQRTVSDPGFSLLRIFTGDTEGYRGLASSVDLSPRTCCLSVPTDDPRLILTPYRCAGFLNRCGCFKPKGERAHPIKLNPIDCLVLFMYHLRYPQSNKNRNDNKNNDNQLNHCPIHKIWQPYLKVLPKVYSDPVFGSFVDGDSLPQTFHSTDLNLSFRRIRLRLLDTWHNLYPIIADDRSDTTTTPFSSSRPPEGFVWSWCTVNSRCVYCQLSEREKVMADHWCDLLDMPPATNSEHTSFQVLLQTRDSPHTALIPFFDFFNHSPTVNCNLKVNELEGLVCLFVDSEISAGKEVFINYGPHENLFLFLEYGFSLQPNNHPNDALFPGSNDLYACLPFEEDGCCDCLRFIVRHLGLDDNFDRQNPIFWPTVCLSSTGPSYHLLFILYALDSIKLHKVQSDEALKSTIDLNQVADLADMTELSENVHLMVSKLMDLLETQCSSDLSTVQTISPRTFTASCCHKSMSCFLENRLLFLRQIKSYISGVRS